MLRFTDISSHNAGLDLAAVQGQIDAVMIKATEGLSYVNPYCDPWVQVCIGLDIPWGFYHYASSGDPVAEADYFYGNCSNYFGSGVPVLDWEGVYSGAVQIYDQSVDWVNAFVRRIHDLTGVWCWIYANPWRFDQGGVEPNCMRWVARYPSVASPTFDQAAGWDAPECDGLVGAWQFCSDGRLDGYDGKLDLDLFYGDENAWRVYAGGDASGDAGPGVLPGSGDCGHSIQTLENDDYKVTIERK